MNLFTRIKLAFALGEEMQEAVVAGVSLAEEVVRTASEGPLRGKAMAFLNESRDVTEALRRLRG